MDNRKVVSFRVRRVVGACGAWEGRKAHLGHWSGWSYGENVCAVSKLEGNVSYGCGAVHWFDVS